MLKHIVFFKLDNFNSTNILASKLRKLKDQIKVIKELEVGINIANEERAYDICLIVIVNNNEDLKIYSTHPKHLIIIDFVKSINATTVIVDYEI